VEFQYYLLLLWRWKWLLAASTLLAAAVSLGYSLHLPRVYRATTTLMVGQAMQNANPSAGDFQTSQQLAQTYVQMVARQPLLEATESALGLGVAWTDLASQVNAVALPQTQLIQISVLSSNPAAGAAIADELAHQLILQSPTAAERERAERQQFIGRQLVDLQERINDAENEIKSLENRLLLENSARGVQDVQNQIAGLQQKIASWRSTYAQLDPTKTGRTNNLSVVEPAVVSPRPVSPNVPLNVLIAASTGLLLALGAALALEYLDDTLKSGEDVHRSLRLPLLGTVASFRRWQPAPNPLVAVGEARTPLAEAYRVVRTNVQSASAGDLGAGLLVTSAVPAEGKSTTACNLAVAIAQTGKRVILCDGDLRRPSVHQLFGVSNAVGLSGLLLDGTLPPATALVETAVSGLRILPGGQCLANPGDLLHSALMQRRLAELQQLADVLIFDSPALLTVADATVLGTLCSSAVLVIQAGRTRVGTVRSAMAALDQIGLPIRGVVLNQVKEPGRAYHGYYSPEHAALGAPRPRGIAGIWSRLVRRHPKTASV
jgi:polysaccharide biosynthesis transport protein